MLLAVIMGFEQSPSSVLSRRRWMRRLLLASLRRMIAFTRNPLVHSVLEKPDTPLNTRKAEGFRGFHNSPSPKVGRFACLRSRNVHRLKPDGLHTGPNNWNKQWRDFFNRYPNPTTQQIQDNRI